MILHNVTSHHRQFVAQNAYATTLARPQSAQTPAGKTAYVGSYFQNIADTGLHSVLLTLLQLQQQTQADKGWILVLGPSHVLSKQLLERYQIETQRVLLINPKQIQRYDNLMRDALTCATCQAVLSFLPEDDMGLLDYQYLANKYQTRLFNHSKQSDPLYVM